MSPTSGCSERRRTRGTRRHCWRRCPIWWHRPPPRIWYWPPGADQSKLAPEELLALERRTHPLTCERDHIDPVIYTAWRSVLRWTGVSARRRSRWLVFSGRKVTGCSGPGRRERGTCRALRLVLGQVDGQHPPDEEGGGSLPGEPGHPQAAQQGGVELHFQRDGDISGGKEFHCQLPVARDGNAGGPHP